MQGVLKRILSFGLAVAMCLGITVAVRGAAVEYVVADAATADTYYSGITAKSGASLLGQLHDLITTTHKTYTSYDDCKRYGTRTDPGLDGRGVLEFYTHETIMSFVGGVGDWNREHVWCQSLSNGLWGTGGGGSDLHHIRPSESGLNSIRGNNKYGKVNGGKEAWSRDHNKNNSKLGGHVGGGTFEPLDNVKGDAARIVMYVYTHYNTYKNVNGTTNGNGRGTFGTLNFTHVITASNENAAKQLLLEWNRLDPVDDIERYRNEEVYKIQGNRNPFIDNSSYAEAIWGDGAVTPPDPVDPTVTLTGLTMSVSSLDLTVGQSHTLSVTATPSNASRAVNWTTSDSSVATVANGTVTAKGEGTATITATSTVNPSIKATATITVEKSNLTGATINFESFSMSGGYGFHNWTAGGISGTAFVYGGADNCLQFNRGQASYYIASTSATPSAIRAVTVKSADGKGQGDREWKLLTSTTPYGEVGGKPTDGNDRGTKTVTPDGVKWTIDGNDTYFALTFELEAEKGAAYLDSIIIEYGSGGNTPVVPPDPIIPVDPPEKKLESIAVHPSSLTVEEGESVKLIVSFVPSDIKAEIDWSSSDGTVATVAADGTVTAVAEGNATITATAKGNSAIKATASVTVKAEEIVDPSVRPESLTINPSSLALKAGGTVKLNVKAEPADASAEVVWTSSDENVLLVASDGTIVAVAAGTAKVTAISKYDDSVKAEATVTVRENVPVVTPAAESFRKAVENLVSSGALEARLTSINAAKTAYDALSETDKTLVTAETVKLNAAIADYNAAAARVSAFRSAVNGIEGTLSERLAAINGAINAYANLTDNDKTAATAETEKLNAEISDYNDDVNSYNSAADEADKTAINGAGGFLKR